MSSSQIGKIISLDTRLKISESLKGRYVSNRKGIPLSFETRKKISESKTNVPYQKLSKECPICKSEMYYKKRCYLLASIRLNKICINCSRKKVSNNSIGKRHSIETCRKMSMSRIGKKFTESHKQNIRLGKAKLILDGKMFPRINEKACKFIDQLNLKNSWNLIHGLNGGEYHIKELGYWVDGFDENLNIIFEYDEPIHYRCGNILRKKDLLRQNNIISYFKSIGKPIRFIRYDEKNNNLYEINCIN
jgi:hypothetical protein